MDDTHALEIGSGFSCAVFRRNLWTACHLMAYWRHGGVQLLLPVLSQLLADTGFLNGQARSGRLGE